MNFHVLRASAIARDQGCSDPVQNIDHSSNTTEDPSNSAFALRDDMTALEIYQECTLLFGPLRPAATRSSNKTLRPSARNLHILKPRGILRGVGTNRGPMIFGGRLKSHRLRLQMFLGKLRRAQANLQVQDPWRTPRAHNEKTSRSLQPQVGNEEPSFPPPSLAGPCPERCVKSSSATSRGSDPSPSRAPQRADKALPQPHLPGLHRNLDLCGYP